MKTIKVDALKIGQIKDQPKIVKASDGKQYHVLGVVTDTVICSFKGDPPLGKRLVVLLGDQVLGEVVERKAGVDPIKRGTGV